MADNKPTNNTSSDEIDLGQLFKMIGKGFNNIFKGFLRIYLYFKKHFWKLTILVVIGFAIGIGLKFFISDNFKTEIIVKPNFDSKDYLYNVVEEIESNIKSKDTTFFIELGIDITVLKNLKIEINPIEEENLEEDKEDDFKYLEILQKFNNDSFISDVVKAEILKKSGMNHKITFSYKNALAGRQATIRLMEYINQNSYFNELKEVYNKNAHTKIIRNQELIGQIDMLIDGYTKGLMENKRMEQGKILLENEKSIEIPSLLSLKNSLIKEMENKNLEIVEQKEVVKIISFGKSQREIKPLYSQGIFVIPLILVTLFFILSFISYLNRKSSELDYDRKF